MAILWYELLVEWRRRLQACRECLRDGGDRSAAAAMLRIRERILCYLLRRYDVQAPEQPPECARPEVSAEERAAIAKFLASLALPEVEPSDAFPPRRGRELGERIADISTQVRSAHRQRWAWWFW